MRIASAFVDVVFRSVLTTLALVRADLEAVAALVAEADDGLRSYATVAPRLDALAALGERERVEREAPPLLVAGTYLEPFALRALAVVREDEPDVRRAAERFRALGLVWHAAQTDEVIGGGSLSGSVTRVRR